MKLLSISSPKVLLYIKVFVVDLLYISVGCVLTWPSPIVGRLNLTDSQVSWVGSLMALGAASGPALNSWAQHRLGRKPALLGAGGAFLASWAVLASSQDFAAICAGRILGGAAMGVAFIGIPVYLTEISDVEERQAVTTFTEFFLGIGYLIVYLGGPNLSYDAVQAVCASITLTFLVAFTILPESPVFLVGRGQKDVALKVLTDLRKSERAAQLELEEIQKFVEEEARDDGKRSAFIRLSEPGCTRALLISVFALTLQQASGVIVMICYLEPILDRLTAFTMERTTAAVIIGCGNLPSILISPPMARYLGTKRTLVICSALMAVSVIVFTVYKECEIRELPLTGLDLVPIIALFLYNVFFCAGLGPLTWSIVAEISPPRVKSLICFLSSTMCWLAAFVLLLVFQPASSALGPTAVFGFFAACLVVGTFLVQVVLPDTKGLSLQQIQEAMVKKNSSEGSKGGQLPPTA